MKNVAILTAQLFMGYTFADGTWIGEKETKLQKEQKLLKKSPNWNPLIRYYTESSNNRNSLKQRESRRDKRRRFVLPLSCLEFFAINYLKLARFFFFNNLAYQMEAIYVNQ